MNIFYQDTFGTWKVTTSANVEGSKSKDLGIFTGFVDEIALHLANKRFYTLDFEKLDLDVNAVCTPLFPTNTETHVTYHIESETWDTIKTPEGLLEVQESFKGRPVEVSASCYYAGFKITKNRS